MSSGVLLNCKRGSPDLVGFWVYFGRFTFRKSQKCPEIALFTPRTTLLATLRVRTRPSTHFGFLSRTKTSGGDDFTAFWLSNDPPGPSLGLRKALSPRLVRFAPLVTLFLKVLLQTNRVLDRCAPFRTISLFVADESDRWRRFYRSLALKRSSWAFERALSPRPARFAPLVNLFLKVLLQTSRV